MNIPTVPVLHLNDIHTEMAISKRCVKGNGRKVFKASSRYSVFTLIQKEAKDVVVLKLMFNPCQQPVPTYLYPSING